MAQQEKDKLLEHDADGIQEYDNALPRWWLYGFYFTCVFGVVYMMYYHILPGNSWNILGFGAKGQIAEYNEEMSSFKKVNTALSGDIKPKLDAVSLEEGKNIFDGTGNVCFTCHRNDLGGQVGPNLTDEYWIHGGAFKDIVQSITTGFPDKGMLPYGSGAKLTNDQLVNVASYIWSMRGSKPPEPKEIDAERDKKYDLEGNLVADNAPKETKQ